MSIALLELAAAALGPLTEELVFVGGATIALHLTDPAAPEPRPTIDVDVVVDAASRAALGAFESRLRGRAFREDQESGVICRWRCDEPSLILDLMPTDPRALGFANQWYPEVVGNPRAVSLPSGARINVIRPELFLATKLAAFEDRGQGDVYSRDFSDLVSVVDGREELEADVRGAKVEVRDYIADSLERLAASDRFLDGVYGGLSGDAASQARAQSIVLPRVESIVAAARSSPS